MPNVQWGDGTTISLPDDKVKLDKSGNIVGGDKEYISKALSLAKENKKPIVGAPTQPEGFLGGLGKSTLGMIESLPNMIPGVQQYQGIKQGLSDIQNRNDPNYQQQRLAESRETLRNAPGVADYNRIKSGDYSGEIGELTPQIITAMMGISPKVRAAGSGGLSSAIESFKDIPTNKYGIPMGAGGIIGGGIGSIASLLGGHPSISEAVAGASAGGSIGALGKALYEGGKGAIKGAASEPRLFNWQESIKPNVVHDTTLPGAESQYSYINRMKEGSDYPRETEEVPPIQPTYPMHKWADQDLLSSPPRIFNMPGSMPIPQNIAEMPPKALPAPDYFGQPHPMPPAGAHILDPREYQRQLPASNLWEEQPTQFSNPTPVRGNPSSSINPNINVLPPENIGPRSRGAIPMGGDVETNLGSKIKVGQTGNKIPTPKVKPPSRSISQIKVQSPKSEAPNVPENKVPESKVPENTKVESAKSKIPENKKGPTEESAIEEATRHPRGSSELQDLGPKEESRSLNHTANTSLDDDLHTNYDPTNFDGPPSKEDKFVGMGFTADLATKHKVPYNTMVERLEEKGYSTISNYELAKMRNKAGGLSVTGKLKGETIPDNPQGLPYSNNRMEQRKAELLKGRAKYGYGIK